MVINSLTDGKVSGTVVVWQSTDDLSPHTSRTETRSSPVSCKVGPLKPFLIIPPADGRRIPRW
jgi:hypothetical protein